MGAGPRASGRGGDISALRLGAEQLTEKATEPSFGGQPGGDDDAGTHLTDPIYLPQASSPNLEAPAKGGEADTASI